MELENLKAKWQESNLATKTAPENELDKLASRMSLLGKDIKRRTIYGISTYLVLSVSVLAFAYFLHLLEVPDLAVFGLLSWVVCMAATIANLFRLRSRNIDVDRTGSIYAYLESKLYVVDSEIRFYQRIAFWLLIPMSAGVLMILLATEASLLIASIELGVFSLIVFIAHRNALDHIAKNLQPLHDDLNEAFVSL